MLTVTKHLVLPTTLTGSLPRPQWYDENLEGRPFSVMLNQVRFREQYFDALACYISDQNRAGLDIVSAFSAVIACINNVGPGLGKVGPAANYQGLTGDITRTTWPRVNSISSYFAQQNAGKRCISIDLDHAVVRGVDVGCHDGLDVRAEAVLALDANHLGAELHRRWINQETR